MQFQIDGNLGYVAAVGELLLQSHVPGHLLLLPALPVALAEHGQAHGLRGRGDVEVWMSWVASAATAAVVRFLSPHPWHLSGITERPDRPGFYQTKGKLATATTAGGAGEAAAGAGAGAAGAADGELVINIVAPNALRLVSSRLMSNQTNGVAVTGPCARLEGDGGSTHADEAFHTRTAHPHWTAQRHVLTLRVVRFPCEVSLCPATRTGGTPKVSAAQCEADLDKLLEVHDTGPDSPME
jgi:hypothetical protein